MRDKALLMECLFLVDSNSSHKTGFHQLLFKSWQERFPYKETGTRLMAQSFLLRCRMDQDYRKKVYKEGAVIHKTGGKVLVQDI